VKVLRLLRVAKLRIIIEKILEYLALSNTIMGLLGFLKLSAIVIFIAHWMACLWHLVSTVGNFFLLLFIDDTSNWILKNGL
jgi:hypothetical protein